MAMLAERHPEQRELIEAYHQRSSEMLAGAIEGTVAILQELRGSDLRLFALSNWSAETFPIAGAVPIPRLVRRHRDLR